MTHTVLIVEDEEDTRELLRELLETEGFSVVAAAEGQEALDRLRALKHVCVVLLDLLMPGMNGWDFYARLRGSQTYAATPVIFTTSAPDRVPKGARVMAKPLDPDKIVSAVRELCPAI